MTTHECYCGEDEGHTVTLDESVQAAIDSQVEVAVQMRTERYRNTVSTLTSHFAEGSNPRALAIPYQPFHNRTDISVPLKVVSE
jgi:hypothetical protein